MSTKVAVVIPVYREELTELEKISLAQCRKILGRYSLVFVAPEEKNFSYFESGDMVAYFPAEYFQSVQTYSRLLTSPHFYAPFLDFDYILIYQLDAFVFYDALEEFCSLGYDYIGAPLPKIFSKIVDGLRVRVNNGGFCLRKVAACYKLLLENADLIERHHELPEDVFFSYCGARSDIDFNIAPINVENAFSSEINFERTVKKNGGAVPFGCHDWTKQDADFYVKLFRQFGYDLRPLKKEFGNGTSQFKLSRALTIVALFRLNRRVRSGRSLSRYLPTKRFAVTVIIRDEMTVKIIKQLFGEEKFSCDGIVDCNVGEVEKIFSTLPKKKLPYLFIGAQENYKTHGRRVVSFRQEYLKRCEEMFHKLGR